MTLKLILPNSPGLVTTWIVLTTFFLCDALPGAKQQGDVDDTSATHHHQLLAPQILAAFNDLMVSRLMQNYDGPKQNQKLLMNSLVWDIHKAVFSQILGS